jgi:hypothetical protein
VVTPSLRVLITGSRDWDDKFPIYAALDVLAEKSTLTIVHGDCPRGADHWAARWHSFYAGHYEERHPADWKQHGKRAGYLRNSEMVRLGADLCLAFIRNLSNGATHCAREAVSAGIPTVIYRQSYPDISEVADALAMVTT